MFLSLAMNTDKMKLLIVGGGCIACRKAQQLLAYDLELTLVAPNLLQDFRTYERVTWLQETYRPDHLKGYSHVIAATDDDDVNHDIYLACQDLSILCSNASNSVLSDFHLPGILQRGPVQISVSTGGKSPGMTKVIKKHIEDNFDETWVEKIEEIHKIRHLLKKNIGSKDVRHDHLKVLASLSLDDLIKRRQKYENKDWI